MPTNLTNYSLHTIRKNFIRTFFFRHCSRTVYSWLHSTHSHTLHAAACLISHSYLHSHTSNLCHVVWPSGEANVPLTKLPQSHARIFDHDMAALYASMLQLAFWLLLEPVFSCIATSFCLRLEQLERELFFPPAPSLNNQLFCRCWSKLTLRPPCQQICVLSPLYIRLLRVYLSVCLTNPFAVTFLCYAATNVCY